MDVLRVTLIALLILVVVACSSLETIADPLTNIITDPITNILTDAPTEAPKAEILTPNIEATVQARVSKQLAAQGSVAPTLVVPTATAGPTATVIPKVVLPTPTLIHKQEPLLSEPLCVDSIFIVSGVVSDSTDPAIIEGVLDDTSVVAVSVVENVGGARNYSLSVGLCDEKGKSIENQYMQLKVNGIFTGQEVLLIPGGSITRNLQGNNSYVSSQSISATPMPVETPKYGEPIIHKPILTIATNSFGNEVYNSRYISSDNFEWWEPLQDRMIHSDRNRTLTNKGPIKSWSLTSNNLGYVYKLRSGLTFHNGDQMTAEDIAFSLKWAFDEEAVSRVRQRIAMIIDQHAIVTGPNEVTIRFTQVNTAFPGYTSDQSTSGGSGGIIHQAAWFENYGDEAYEANPVPSSAGPFTMLSYSYGDSVLYERWDGYRLRPDREYAFNELSVRLISEQSAQLAALRTGTVDIIPADLSVVDQIKYAGGGKLFYSPEATVIWINANSCSSDQPAQAGGAGMGKDLQGRTLMCNDKDIRYAMDYAIDKEMIQTFFGGPDSFQIKGIPGVSPSGLGYGPGLDPFEYNPDKARQIFAQKGYPDGAGFNYDEPYQVWTWPAGASAPRIVEMAELFCSMWEKELNVECDVNVGEEVSVKDKQYSGAIPGEQLIRSVESGYDAGSKYKGRFGTSSSSYITYDPILEAKINVLLAAVTPEEKQQAYYATHKQVHDSHWDWSPGYLNKMYGVNPNIKQWNPWPISESANALWSIRFAD